MRKGIERILCMSFWAAAAAAAAVMHDQRAGGTLTESTSMPSQSSHYEFVKLPAPPSLLTATALTTSTVRLQWSPGSLTSTPLSFTIERLRKAPRRTSDFETMEDDVKYYVNTTICLRERRKNTEHYLVLESDATCLSNVRGLPPKTVKPLYVAFVELVALSLVVSAITCMFVHFGLEYLKKTVKSRERREGDSGRPFEECLKSWMREEEEDKEPDERSRIISTNRATSV